MGRGRPRTPTVMKIASGAARVNPGRIRDDEPKQLSDEPVCPDHLNEIEREAWEQLATVLRGMGMLSASYQQAMEIHCEAYYGYRTAREQVEEYGQVNIGRDLHGNTKIHSNPMSAELHKYRAAVRASLSEFGLGPSSKAKVGAAAEESRVAESVLSLVSEKNA